MNNYDNIESKEKWEFDDAVTNCFDNMLERSIPQYELMRQSVANLCYDVITNIGLKKQHFSLLDIGCSNGIMIEKLIDTFEQNRYDGYSNYTGVDISLSMLENAKQRLSQFLSNDESDKIRVFIDNCDLRYNFPGQYYDIITSILSIQFIPIEYRQGILQSVYDSLSDVNGCFIMVEKILGNTSKLNKLFVKNYYDLKLINGYSKEQINRKRLSLEGVLVPITNDWNVSLLKQVGFKEVDVFWRWMNFVGYIAIK